MKNYCEKQFMSELKKFQLLFGEEVTDEIAALKETEHSRTLSSG